MADDILDLDALIEEDAAAAADRAARAAQRDIARQLLIELRNGRTFWEELDPESKAILVKEKLVTGNGALTEKGVAETAKATSALGRVAKSSLEAEAGMRPEYSDPMTTGEAITPATKAEGQKGGGWGYAATERIGQEATPRQRARLGIDLARRQELDAAAREVAGEPMTGLWGQGGGRPSSGKTDVVPPSVRGIRNLSEEGQQRVEGRVAAAQRRLPAPPQIEDVLPVDLDKPGPPVGRVIRLSSPTEMAAAMGPEAELSIPGMREYGTIGGDARVAAPAVPLEPPVPRPAPVLGPRTASTAGPIPGQSATISTQLAQQSLLGADPEMVAASAQRAAARGMLTGADQAGLANLQSFMAPGGGGAGDIGPGPFGEYWTQQQIIRPERVTPDAVLSPTSAAPLPQRANLGGFGAVDNRFSFLPQQGVEGAIPAASLTPEEVALRNVMLSQRAGSPLPQTGNVGGFGGGGVNRFGLGGDDFRNPFPLPQTGDLGQTSTFPQPPPTTGEPYPSFRAPQGRGVGGGTGRPIGRMFGGFDTPEPRVSPFGMDTSTTPGVAERLELGRRLAATPTPEVPFDPAAGVEWPEYTRPSTRGTLPLADVAAKRAANAAANPGMFPEVGSIYDFNTPQPEFTQRLGLMAETPQMPTEFARGYDRVPGARTIPDVARSRQMAQSIARERMASSLPYGETPVSIRPRIPEAFGAADATAARALSEVAPITSTAPTAPNLLQSADPAIRAVEQAKQGLTAGAEEGATAAAKKGLLGITRNPEALSARMLNALPGTGRVANFIKGGVLPSLPGVAMTTAGGLLERETDEQGIGRTDAGQFLKGAGTIATFGVPLALGSGPIGWGALGLAALGAGLWNATRGKQSLDDKVNAMLEEANLPNADTWRAQAKTLKAGGMADDEILANLREDIPAAMQALEVEKERAKYQLSPADLLAYQSQYAQAMKDATDSGMAQVNAAYDQMNQYADMAGPAANSIRIAAANMRGTSAAQAMARQLAALNAPVQEYLDMQQRQRQAIIDAQEKLDIEAALKRAGLSTSSASTPSLSMDTLAGV